MNSQNKNQILKIAFQIQRALFIATFILVTAISIQTTAQLMSDYTQKVGKLSNLEAKVKSLKDGVKLSLAEMQKSKDEKIKKEHFSEAMKQHNELQKSTREYNVLRDELKYKYPKKHDQTVRNYQPIREVTIEEIENEMGLDGILDRVKVKAEKKYEVFNKDPLPPTPKKKKIVESSEENKLRLEK